MPKRIIGLVAAVAIALFGGAALPVPALAVTPQHIVPGEAVPAQTLPAVSKAKKAAKKKAAKAKAAAAARAKASPQAKAKAAARARAKARAKAAAARDAAIIGSGPRAAAAARSAATARARFVVASQAAARSRARAAAAARAAATVRARAAAMPAKTKKQAEAKKKALKAAKNAATAAAKESARARGAIAAQTRARAEFIKRARAAQEAQAKYVALAGPRANLAARKAARARAQTAAVAKQLAIARGRAAAARMTANAARLKTVAVLKSTASKKQKKVAVAAYRKVVRAWQAANARVNAGVVATAKAQVRAKAMTNAATAARRAAGPNVNWAPTDSLTFNHPRGSKRQKYALIAQLNRAIDATPRDGYIRIAMYLFDINSVTNKLIAADRRGVNVQVLMDDGMNNAQVRKLKKALGKNKRSGSFLATCDHSCMSQGASTIHAKFYLFSVAGRSRYVSLISSGNPYSGNTVNSWNNTHTITSNRSIYGSLLKYFTDMLPDKTNLNYYRVTKSGKYTVYYYPQKIRKPDDLVWMHVLNRVSCGRTAPGYGNAERRTLIRVAQWGWTMPRADVARRLWKLHDAGCRVQIITNRARVSKGIFRILLKRSKRYGQMPVYNAWKDWKRKLVAGLYMHHKIVTIDGVLAGRNVKMTLTGSQNFTSLGTQANNDLVLRVDDARMTNAYNTNFAFVRDHYTNRMRKVPKFARPKGLVGGR